jgi:predicted dehydrogenase
MTSDRAPVRLGLIGCGRLAELGYAPAIAALEEVELKAVADPEPRRRDRLAELIAARGAPPRTHETAGRLLADGEIDGVIIASPVLEHLRQAELASRAGIPCLIEKPPAVNVAGAERIAGLEPAPWVGFNRRFQHRAALDLSGSDEPLSVELEIRYRRASWRAVTVDDEAVMDLGPHLVDLALVVLGPGFTRVRSAALSEARAEIELESERGRARIRCATDRPHRERVIVRDRRGRVVSRSHAGGPLAAIGGRVPGRSHPLVTSLRDQVAAFASVVRGGEAGGLATAADGVRAMAVIDEARTVAAGREQRS